MSDPTQYLQVTNTLGYQVTIPLVGPFESGIAVNPDQIGVYMTTPLAPDDSLVRALRMVNTISSEQGFGNMIDPGRLDEWDSMNGTSFGLRGFTGVNFGGYIGSIEELSSFHPDGSVNPSINLSGAAYGYNVAVIVPAEGLTEADGLPSGTGITIGFGVGLGVSGTPTVTFAIPLIGENGVFLDGYDFLSSSRQLEQYLRANNLERLPTIDEIREMDQKWYDSFIDSFADVASTMLIVAVGPVLAAEILKARGEECFGPEVSIDMWPLDPDLIPGPDGIYDQDEVYAKIWKKPIEQIEVGDLVVSFDKNENLVPGPVTRLFRNDAKILLDFHGTRVTPGHVYYRADSKKSYKFETLIDVLRDDGVIQQQDGTLIRATTNVPVGDLRDGFVRAVTGTLKSDGSVDVKDEGRIRVGTRFIVGEGKERKSFAVADLIQAGGGVVGDDELIRVDDGEPMPFHWEFGDLLPKPEDFVLAGSGTTLEDIYKAAEWESQGPRLPAPMVLDGGPVQPLKGAELSAMPRNEPLNLGHMPEARQKPYRMMNRKHAGS
ncbi:hypothetical protein SAMN04488118_1128 [Epibacterium ulvae]|uniref:Hint domain-containing protein n=1 Tax=Epibacterium ulvae TaxID=1156985 RepID=A0A1G5RCB7_9RHOB|nr:hypothetical protein [Epibacterium ulvae]SCZ71430.1 hypothetical protein SAMN04488118_1128 [Epibacterium ulvae]